MCGRKCFDFAAIIVSLLSGIVFVILTFFGLIQVTVAIPAFLIALGGFALFLLTLVATSLLRQDRAVNRCLCEKGLRVLISALLLLSLGAFILVFIIPDIVVLLILTFLAAALASYLLLSLYCLLSCVILAGCPHRPCDDD